LANRFSSRSTWPHPNFYNHDGTYTFKKIPPAKTISGVQLVDFYAKLVGKYPIVSIEDGCAEGDWKHWKMLTDKIGDKIQLVGDDLFVTNVKFLQKGIDTGTANSILVKVNQIGSLTETLDAVATCAVQTNIPPSSRTAPAKRRFHHSRHRRRHKLRQIKTGSLSRSDRLAKYNQLLRIEQLLGKNAVYAGTSALPKSR